jgi:peptidoglycan/LPS O-acetylase OafA/YrhL
MWTQSIAWPTSSAVMALGALSATVAIALGIGWVIRRFSVAGRPVSERTLILVSCIVFGAVIAFAMSVVLDVLPASYVAGPAVAVAQRAWEMTLGALVGGLVVTGSLPPRVHPVLGSAALVFIVVAVVRPELLEIPHGVMVGIAGAVLLAEVAATHPSRGLNAVATSGALQVTGRFGYCWYLWHLPAILLAPLVLGSSLSWLQSIEVIVLAFWAAGLTYAVLGRRRVGGGSLPIEDHPHVHGHASAHLPTALRSWHHAPRATAGVGTQAGPAPHFGPPTGTTNGGRS